MTEVRRPASQAVGIGSTVVTVRVSSTNRSQDFLIHDSFLVKSSDFFAAALRGEWRESIERVIPLPDLSPDHFNIYFHWLYSGKIYSAPDGYDKKPVQPQVETEFKGEMSSLVRCWTMGQRLMDTKFMDTVMDALIHLVEDAPSFINAKADVAVIYKETLPGSMLRRFIIEQIVQQCTEEFIDHYGDVELPREFLQELLHGLAAVRGKNRDNKPQWLKNPCAFHEHKREGKACYKDT
ncbi:hypothetical protein BU16DRAFT_4689 [Lophium mytilinum]|uniref:BTB domain-containing protein n=1 Tax=Lophium mytilinum TaxID=390894 RepID=A0A6A6REY3_9PEZI|nr:hypothetical protein BU16DRAFT_4689 [Lophium mytilinum]